MRDANGNKGALTPHQQQTAVYGGLGAIVFSFLLLSEDTDAVVYSQPYGPVIYTNSHLDGYSLVLPADAGVLFFFLFKKNAALTLDREAMR